ncbi:diphosphomevalonate decarboxylase [Flavobacteriaceae bacterium]|nr:diphosphomevalonate decarboxylase [Flavobacteriaceae bacterium]
MDTQQFIPNSLQQNTNKVSFTWKTPSNIALVKYWGKTDPQIPKNASISFTLSNSHTITRIDFTPKSVSNSEQGEINFELFFEGKKKEDFKPKIAKFFDRIQEYCPYVIAYDMVISSENSFPHSSGIASSASGMSAIAMCLMSLEQTLSSVVLSDDFINKKASFLARLGSGSASRSIEGPLVVWGNHPVIEGSSDLFGVPFPYKVHEVFNNYQDAILLVDKGEKQVSSTVGHDLMHNHPFATQRFQQANENLATITDILQQGELDLFINLVESEALSLHAMMLTSSPYFVLMKPNTLEIINAIWRYRDKTGSKVCFTLDAGANVHVLYPANETETIAQFIDNELSKFCQKNHYICDIVGLGAVNI